MNVTASSDRQKERRRILRLRARIVLLARRLPGPVRLRSGLEHALLAAVAGVLAYVPTRGLGLKEGFWAAITAIAVLQVQLDATRNTARNQFTGAAIGGVIGGAMVATAGAHVWSYALAVVLAVLACWVANIASAARLAGTTATILMLVPHAGSVLVAAMARISEVGWGVAVALGVVWVADRVGRVFRLRRARHELDKAERLC